MVGWGFEFLILKLILVFHHLNYIFGSNSNLLLMLALILSCPEYNHQPVSWRWCISKSLEGGVGYPSTEKGQSRNPEQKPPSQLPSGSIQVTEYVHKC